MIGMLKWVQFSRLALDTLFSAPRLSKIGLRLNAALGRCQKFRHQKPAFMRNLIGESDKLFDNAPPMTAFKLQPLSKAEKNHEENDSKIAECVPVLD